MEGQDNTLPHGCLCRSCRIKSDWIPPTCNEPAAKPASAFRRRLPSCRQVFYCRHVKERAHGIPWCILANVSASMALWDETSGHNGCVLFVVAGIFLFHNIHVCYQKIGSCESGFIKMSFCRKGAALHHKRQQLTSVFDHIEWGREANLSLDVCFFLVN